MLRTENYIFTHKIFFGFTKNASKKIEKTFVYIHIFPTCDEESYQILCPAMFMIPQLQPQTSVSQCEWNPILYRICDRTKNAAIIGNETILKK